VWRYAQLHTIGATQEDPEAELRNAASIVAFASPNDVEDHLVSRVHKAITASKANLCGEGFECRTFVNYSVINRLQPELAT
jgi:hypothetical protein